MSSFKYHEIIEEIEMIIVESSRTRSLNEGNEAYQMAQLIFSASFNRDTTSSDAHIIMAGKLAIEDAIWNIEPYLRGYDVTHYIATKTYAAMCRAQSSPLRSNNLQLIQEAMTTRWEGGNNHVSALVIRLTLALENEMIYSNEMERKVNILNVDE